MRRLSQSGGREKEPSDGVLTEKWVVQGAPPPSEEERWPLVEHSFVEFEDLNTLGRFSFNKYNKETEVGSRRFNHVHVMICTHTCLSCISG